jgi:hypothetical protein
MTVAINLEATGAREQNDLSAEPSVAAKREPGEKRAMRQKMIVGLLPFVFALTAPFLADATAQSADNSTQLDSWKESFHKTWASDSCDVQKQSWTAYWGWVREFYFGKGPAKGWFAESTDLLSNVTTSTTKAALGAELELLGRRIGGEWAKDNGCRRIRTTTGLMNLGEHGKPAIDNWGNELREAKARDSGDGKAIQQATDRIRDEVDLLLGSAQAVLSRPFSYLSFSLPIPSEDSR